MGMTITLDDKQTERLQSLATACHTDTTTVLNDALGALEHNLDTAREELYRLLDEGEADELAGRVYPIDEVFDTLYRDIEDGKI